MKRNAKQLLKRLKQNLKSVFFPKIQQPEPEQHTAEEEESNCYIPRFREIIEIILKSRNIPYRSFAPILLDGGDAEQALLAAQLLGPDLNKMAILTDRPAYFTGYTDTMYEEYGLIVEVYPKDPPIMEKVFAKASSGTVILDFEKTTERKEALNFGKIIYLPIYKKRWESAGNLDIAVPIGYNTMIVRVKETTEKRPYLDKFEQAFYENE